MKIVFDFGGVVFDWLPHRLIARELPTRVADEAAARHWAGLVFQGYGGDWGDFDRGTVEPDELAERIARRTGLAPEEARRVIDGVPEELQPKPQTVALIRCLHEAGRELFYLSNMPAPIAAELEARHAFLGCFRDGVFSARVHHNKPEPAIFELAAARFDAAPQQLLFIDDHAPNIEAARALGWQGFVFESPAQAEVELQRRGLLDG